jgi:hypothetical protein
MKMISGYRAAKRDLRIAHSIATISAGAREEDRIAAPREARGIEARSAKDLGPETRATGDFGNEARTIGELRAEAGVNEHFRNKARPAGEFRAETRATVYIRNEARAAKDCIAQPKAPKEIEIDTRVARGFKVAATRTKDRIARPKEAKAVRPENRSETRTDHSHSINENGAPPFRAGEERSTTYVKTPLIQSPRYV